MGKSSIFAINIVKGGARSLFANFLLTIINRGIIQPLKFLRSGRLHAISFGGNKYTEITKIMLMISQNYSYRELVDRNWGYITNDLQDKIKRSRLFFAGCGLGSLIAETAARLGFSNFTLADGDIVEASNLNRQAFDKSHIGVNKATAISSVLKKINPKVNIKVIKKNIASNDIPILIRQSDFIINTVDFGKVYFDLVKIGQENKKHILLPYNIGFGGLVLIFNESTKSLDEILGSGIISNDIIFYKTLLNILKPKNLPSYIKENTASIFSNMKLRRNNPQIVIGAEIVSALVITSIVKILSGKKVPMAPRYIHKDIF